MSNWDDATARLFPICPKCGEHGKMIERDGKGFSCKVCATFWMPMPR